MPEINHGILEDENLLWIENDALRLGVNLGLGGAVTFLAEHGRPNLINSHDWGRQVQMSFYSHPVPYEPEGKTVNENWRYLGWNPIQSGDCYGHRSKVLAYRTDGNEIQVECVPMQWPMDDCPGECTFEVRYRLEGCRVDVTARLRNARSDTAQYPARAQELPAVYTNGVWYKLVSYTGTAPYTGAPLTELCTKENGLGWPWVSYCPTEHWAALVDDDGYGLGVCNPMTNRFIGGFAGKMGAGGPKDAPTGYISPLLTEVLDHNIVYEYAYSLIPGPLERIRDEACAFARRRRQTDFRFDENRAHFFYRDTVDQGFPTGGSLRFDCAPGAALVAPDLFVGRQDAKTVFIDGAFTSDTGTIPCALAVSEYDGQFHAEEHERPVRELPFSLTADGVRRETAVDISGLGVDFLGFSFEFRAAGHAEVYRIRLA